MSSARPVLPLASALGLVLTFPAVAAESADFGAAAAAKELDKVEVHGERVSDVQSPKFVRPLLDTPQTVTLVPAEQMRQQGVTTLRDALRNVPGISLQAGEGGVPAGDNLSLRGFSARTDLFVDGVRDFGGYSRDPFNLEQVEVVKGPASAQTGRGSTGGSINLASKTARAEDFTHASLSAGDNDLGRVTVDVNRAVGEDAALRVNLLGHRNEVNGRDVVENERWAIAPTMSFGLGGATRVNLSLFHLEQDNVPDYGQPWVPDDHAFLPRGQRAPVDRGNWYGVAGFDYEKTETDMATVELRHAFSDTVSLRNLTRWGESARDSVITAPRFVPNTTTINRTLKTRDSEDRILANLTDLSLGFTTGSVQHDLVAGLEIARERSRNRARTAPNGPVADLFTPNPNAPYTEVIAYDPLRDAEAEADTVAAYVVDTLALAPRWELSGGLRWDRLDVEAQAYDNALAARADYTRTDTMLSGRAALVFKPQDNGSVYVGYGTSFNPSAEGLSLNPALAAVEPEESRTLELGTKWSVFGERLLLSSAVFRTEKTNARIDDPSVDGTLYALEGEQRVDGFEISAAGRITDTWTLNAGYAWLDGEITRDRFHPEQVGNVMPNTPEHSASLWSLWELTPALSLGFGAQHVGARYTNAANLRQAKSYTLYDAMLGYRLNDAVSLRLNALNLTDKDYVDQVGGGHYTPGAARTVMLSADFSF